MCLYENLLAKRKAVIKTQTITLKYTVLFLAGHSRGSLSVLKESWGKMAQKHCAGVKILCKQEGSKACRISFCIGYLLQLWLDSLCFPLFIYRALSDVFKGLNVIPEYEEQLPVGNVMMS